MKRFTKWMVWNPLAGAPRYQYSTFVDAKVEAERLAASNVGSEFFVLQVVGSAKVDKPAIFTKYEENDGIPF